MRDVTLLADAIHLDHPEDEAVLAERRLLYPDGCFVLEGHNGLAGYAITHPWIFAQPPALDTLLGTLPDPASTYYIHDVAIAPIGRGTGQTHAVLERILHVASMSGLSNLSLVAVNDSAAFWKRHGFSEVASPALERKLISYGKGATFMVRNLST